MMIMGKEERYCGGPPLNYILINFNKRTNRTKNPTNQTKLKTKRETHRECENKVMFHDPQ